MSRPLPVIQDESDGPAAGAQGEAGHHTKGLLRLTMACNERCVFCNVPVEDFRPVTPSLAALAAELDAFIASGEQTLTISGGEPTLLRERLLDVVARARAAGVPFVELQTNAVLLDDDYAQALARAGVTSAFVSFLSHVPALHDGLAGLEGAYADCLRGMDALLDAGIAVTLNPVTAHVTQELVADYVAFVAQRLPRVRAISLSAVQPHGRAKDNPDLLPDYRVLKGQVVLAQERANANGIRLLNPYCGLPLCVGWEESAERSVEAVEALEQRSQQAFGVDNRQNKRHGEPCRGCALRTRCGGAWNAYWEVRGGSGIEPPLARVEPWRRGASQATGQRIVAARSPGELPVAESRDAGEPLTSAPPTTWFMTSSLRLGDGAVLRRAGITDLALLTTAAAFNSAHETRRALSELATINQGFEPQQRLRVALGLTALGSLRAAAVAIQRAANVGIDTVDILLVETPTLTRFVDAVRASLPPGVSLSVGPEGVG
ncbi:MAG: radical SAM protein [Sandaracinaceae bacterium]|nr:radical SAM protein [Sandaracinaceae bacterium]MBP7682179.1 radical SAM protein [Deltaproteobacteria bacterium]